MASFLHLPGELRNAIYELVVADLHPVRSALDASVAWVVGTATTGSIGPRVGPHPLTHACRQTRSEFVSVLFDVGAKVQSSRHACVNDFKMLSLTKELEQCPSIQSPTALCIEVQLTILPLRYPGELIEWLEHYNVEDGTTTVCMISYLPVFQVQAPQFHSKPTLAYAKAAGHFSDKLADFCSRKRRELGRKPFRKTNLGPAVNDIRSKTINALRKGEKYRVKNFVLRSVLGKHHTKAAERQEKRRKLCEEGEWNLEEGFDLYGDKDEEYHKLLEGIGRLEL